MRMKIFTLSLCTMFAVATLAQKPSYEVQQASVAPVIDGVVDDVWNEADPAYIYNSFKLESPTLGSPGETYWKGLWRENEGVYLLLIVNDDVFYPNYAVDPAGNSWEYDKPEIYFDCNFILEDDLGAIGEGQPGNGHHQCAPMFENGKIDGVLLDAGVNGEVDADDAGVLYAFMVNDPDYIAEYFFPLEYFTDRNGFVNNLGGEVGFDVTIIDRDPGDTVRNRAVWANTGLSGGSVESWVSMDECGILTFEGAESNVEITLTGGEITENNGTLQIIAEVLPAEATEQLSWSVTSGADGGRATIDSKGLVTGLADGTVIVTCQSAPGFVMREIYVPISNQIATREELNIIRNGNFDRVNPGGAAAEWSGWGGSLGAPLPTVIEGVAVCTPIRNPDDDFNYQYLFTQSNLTALPNTPYEFSFVAWADQPRTFSVNFEDTPGNGYNRYGATSDPRSADGRSEWTFDVTTEPVKYVFDVTFDQIQPTTVQKVQYMLGLSNTICYIDSVMLVNMDQLTNYTPVTQITLTGEGGATLVEEEATLQMIADVLPEDADYQDMKWRVEPGTGLASIDETGLLTGVSMGTVTVIASAVDESEVEGSSVITVCSKLEIYPGEDVEVCLGETVNLTAEGDFYGEYTISWNNGIEDGVDFIPTETDDYIVAVTNLCGSSYDTVRVIVRPLSAEAGEDMSICSGESVTLTATGGVLYEWDKGIVNGEPFTPTVTDVYHVTVTNSYGCPNSDSVRISVYPLPFIDAGEDREICYGEEVTLSATGDGALSWGNGVIDDEAFQPEQTNEYYLYTIDEFGCRNADTVTITVIHLDTSVTVNGNILIANAVNTSLQWMDCISEEIITGETNKSFAPAENGTYAVEVTQSGCTAVSSCYEIIVVGISNRDFGSGLKYYPNPMSGKVTFDLGDIYDDILLKVYDMTGEVLISNTHNGKQFIETDMHAYAPGFYLVDIINKDQKVTLKIIKEK